MKHKIVYPFYIGERDLYDATTDTNILTKTWEAGTGRECADPYCEETRNYANGEGFMVLTEVSRHKPGKYPERVFYTRKFIDPDGKEFGKRNLRVCSAAKFKRLCEKYAYNYVLDPDEPCNATDTQTVPF